MTNYVVIRCRQEVSTSAVCPWSESCLPAQLLIVNAANKSPGAVDAGCDVGDVLMLDLETVCRWEKDPSALLNY